MQPLHFFLSLFCLSFSLSSPRLAPSIISIIWPCPLSDVYEIQNILHEDPNTDQIKYGLVFQLHLMKMWKINVYFIIPLPEQQLELMRVKPISNHRSIYWCITTVIRFVDQLPITFRCLLVDKSQACIHKECIASRRCSHGAFWEKPKKCVFQ